MGLMFFMTFVDIEAESPTNVFNFVLKRVANLSFETGEIA